MAPFDTIAYKVYVPSVVGGSGIIPNIDLIAAFASSV
jgi:hypothetical protein